MMRKCVKLYQNIAVLKFLNSKIAKISRDCCFIHSSSTRKFSSTKYNSSNSLSSFNKVDNSDRKKCVLGIETSCDDTGAAIVDEDGTVLGERLASQTATHVEFGGILPPVARDLHASNIENVVQSALQEAKMSAMDVDAIATTIKPGLVMSLTVGLKYTRELIKRINYRKPFIPIHHMEAHALTVRMINEVDFPYLVLLISGGHCLLAVARGVDDFLLIGQSLDVSPGDAFDKTARRLGLKNHPDLQGMAGGQAIEVMAKKGDPKAFPVPRVMASHQDCNFSFSGLKVNAKKLIENEEKRFGIKMNEFLPNLPDFCASFQYSILHHIAKRVQRGLLFCEMKGLLNSNQKTMVISGGVGSNEFIRSGIAKVCAKYDCNLICPPSKLCTDNGIMIAWNGVEKLKLGIGFADVTDVDVQNKSPFGKDISDQVRASTIKNSSIKLL